VTHASRTIPSDVRGSLLVADDELERELVRMMDAYTDELFAFAEARAVVFPTSRLVVDPERFEHDEDEPMSARGMDVIYTRTSHGEVLRHPP
jgi:N-formylglutamate deformylase